jgi:CheY-specific phosphatase CheX/anti-anti-sigma regulatory factor
MKPIVKKRISAFYPQGFIDSNNAYFIITDDDINFSFEKEAKMMLVSLRRVVFFNINGISILLDSMKKARDKNPSLTIGFCDYSTMQYDTIKRFFEKNLDFSLYRTFKVATLFTTPSIAQESILVWNESYEQRNLQSIELFERGYNPVVVHKEREYLEHVKREGAYDEVVKDTFIGSVGIVPFARVSGSAIIYTLTGYLDATIDYQFDYSYHKRAIRTGFKLFIFDMKNIVSMNVKVLDFFKKLVREAEKYKGTIAIVNLSDSDALKRIREEVEKAGVRFFITLDEILNNKKLMMELGGIIKEDHIHGKSVTRNLITHLPSFINATVSTLEMMLGVPAVKTGRIKIKDLEVSQGNKKLASSIGFYGDLEGIIILVFPFSLAKKSCSMMIGEEISSLAEVLDSLAEFVNVIAGRVKTHLADQNIGVSITLPRTYSSTDELIQTLSLGKGIQVDLNFNEETFTFFLTR